MEDGVKEGTAKPTETKFIGKAGWVKKSSGKFLGGYKDRYVLVEKTEIAVYEKEDLENCIDRVDLEKYDRCCGARSAFQKKNRLVLIPSPKSKVHDIKFQVASPEERDAWIKAISDAINRAKNKVFDEVKVDESCSLEHVTRSRPKGNQSRRPPTRIHMKEVASASSDGMLRLDLDVTDSIPNGTYHVSSEVEVPKEAIKPPMPPTKLTEKPQQGSSEEPSQQTAVIKPPMPPSKESKPIAPSVEVATDKECDKREDSSKPPEEAENNDSSPAETLAPPIMGPPAPPSKDMKPTLRVQDEIAEQPSCLGDTEEERSEKPSSQNDLTVPSEQTATEEYSVFEAVVSPLALKETECFVSDQEDVPCMTTEQKPTRPAVVLAKEEESVTSNNIIEEDGGSKSAITTSSEVTESATTHTKPPDVCPESVRKSPGPPAPPKKKPLKPPHISAQLCDVKTANVPTPSEVKFVETVSDTSSNTLSLSMDTMSAVETKSAVTIEDTSHLIETVIPPAEIPSTIGTGNVIVGDIDAMTKDKTTPSPADTDSSTAFISSLTEDSPAPEEDAGDTPKSQNSGFVFLVSNYDTGDNLNLSVEKLDQEEMRSSDSGQHSDDEMESCDNIRASTIALSGSRTRLDEDICEDSTDLTDVSLGSPASAMEKGRGLHDIMGDVQAAPLHSYSALLSSAKGKSPSLGDLLSSSRPVQQLLQEQPLSQRNNINELHCKTLLELKATEELFEKVSGDTNSASNGGEKGELSPQKLLAQAVQKLQEAEQVLREARSLKEFTAKRKSW